MRGMGFSNQNRKVQMKKNAESIFQPKVWIPAHFWEWEGNIP